ncbi:MAG: hypothetical protein ABSB01_26065 [Streptosporangiaceae bacterium]|jgi:hypothetical protein
MAGGRAELAASGVKKEKKKLDLANNAIVAGVVSAVVAGLISFLVTHFQDEDAASQARAAVRAQVASQTTSQQVQEVGKLETDADGLYVATQSAYSSYSSCYAAHHGTWGECHIKVEPAPTYSTVSLAYETDLSDIADPTIVKLGNKLSGYLFGSIADAIPAQADTAWFNAVDAYNELTSRCGQFIQGRVHG